MTGVAILHGVPMDSLAHRLIASDMAEERGDMALASALRDTERPLSMRGGVNSWSHRFAVKENPWLQGLAQTMRYRKREITVIVADSVDITGTYWSGGSRDEYWEWHIDGRCVAPIRGTQNGINPAEAPTVKTRPGFAVVQGGTFLGKTANLYVRVHPSDAYRFGIEYVPAFPE